MSVIRHDLSSGCARIAENNGLALFTGHVAGNRPSSLYLQTEAVLARYVEMIERFGYKREHLVAAYGYTENIEDAADFHKQMQRWCGSDHKPVCTLVGAAPSANYGLELALFFACADASGKKEEIKVRSQGNSNGYAEVAFHNGFAYFSGVYADPEVKGMRAETENILQKYEQLFDKYGLNKSDMVYSNCYVSDMSIVDEYGDPWCAWAGDKVAPAGVCVEARLEGDRTVLIQLVLAAPEIK